MIFFPDFPKFSSGLGISFTTFFQTEQFFTALSHKYSVIAAAFNLSEMYW